MQTTAESGSVPTTATLTTRIADTTGHRVDVLSDQYRRITGEAVDKSDPTEICGDLTTWVRENELSVRTLLDDATDTFSGVSFDSIEEVFETAWDGDQIEEAALVASSVRQQAKTYENVNEILDGDPSPWAQLESAGETLRAEHSESPTTEAVETLLGSSRPPSLQRVQQLIDEADDPKPPGADDDVWAELQRVAEELRQELPNATITDQVTAVVDADDRPTEDRSEELLSEARTVLDRMRSLEDRLDELPDNSIVLINSD